MFPGIRSPLIAFTAKPSILVAGTFFGIQGYQKTFFGSLDKEPVPGLVLSYMYNFGGASASLSYPNHVKSLLIGKQPYINSVAYPNFSWTEGTNDGNKYTSGSWSSGGPSLVSGVTYRLEIK